MAIETYNGIKVPTSSSDLVNSGTSTVGGILIDNDKTLADRILAIENGGGLSVSSSRSGLTTTVSITAGNSTNTFTVSDGTNAVSPALAVTDISGGHRITITDQNGTRNVDVMDGNSSWTESTLVDGANTLADGTSFYLATAASAVTLSAPSSWATGNTSRVGVTFASSSTFSYPAAWKCIGDDCASGVFTFAQGSSYWLTIECKPDGTWMHVIKCPSVAA